MRTFVLEALTVLVLHLRPFVALGQSFTQTIGGLSSEVGIGAIPVGQDFRVGLRVYDQYQLRHSATFNTMGPAGTFQSAVPLEAAEELFPQAQVNASDGVFFLIGSQLPGATNDHDGFVARVNADGTVAWLSAPELAGSQQYLGGVALPDGGVAVCGLTDANGGHNALVARFDATGALVWTHIEPSATEAEAYGIAKEGSTLMVTGRQQTFAGTDDVLFLRMDLSGTVNWTTTKGGAANEECRSIVSVGGGTFVAGGWTNSYGMRDLTRDTIPFHAYLIAIDMEGDTLWTKALGDTLYERHVYALERAPNGDLLIAGERGTSALSDALLMRTTSDGTPTWERSIDTGKEERLVHLVPLPDGLIGTGWSFGEFSGQLLFIRRNAEGF